MLKCVIETISTTALENNLKVAQKTVQLRGGTRPSHKLRIFNDQIQQHSQVHIFPKIISTMIFAICFRYIFA